MVGLDKILILTSGDAKKLNAFENVAKASFDDISFSSASNTVKVAGKDLRNFKVIYFRMVGRSFETASVVVEYARKNKIRIVDKVYSDRSLFPVSLGKSIELRKLIEKGIPIPKTYFGKVNKLNFPYILKSTTGQKSLEVWLIKNKKDLDEVPKTRNKIYFAQEFIPESKRIRILVIGNKVIGGLLRGTKWGKEKIKQVLDPIPKKVSDLALRATRAVGLDICGVDILVAKNNRMYVIETNAAPSWKSIKEQCGKDVENEIIEYLRK